MNSVVETNEDQPRALAPSNDSILSTVAQTETIGRFVPLGILVLVCGLPTLGAIFRQGLGSALLTGIITFIIAGLVIRIVDAIILRPMRHVRYKAAAKTLAGQMQSIAEPVAQWFSWWTFAPGALAITKPGHLVIVDRSTDYTHLWLSRDQIVNVGVERQATQITNTRHSGTFTFGGVSGGLLGAFSTGGRSKSTTTTVETAFVEIRYQLERNGPVYTSVIPFGSDRRGAEQLSAQITRLERL
jgi:hypothetical protein